MNFSRMRIMSLILSPSHCPNNFSAFQTQGRHPWPLSPLVGLGMSSPSLLCLWILALIVILSLLEDRGCHLFFIIRALHCFQHTMSSLVKICGIEKNKGTTRNHLFVSVKKSFALENELRYCYWYSYKLSSFSAFSQVPFLRLLPGRQSTPWAPSTFMSPTSISLGSKLSISSHQHLYFFIPVMIASCQQKKTMSFNSPKIMKN